MNTYQTQLARLAVLASIGGVCLAQNTLCAASPTQTKKSKTKMTTKLESKIPLISIRNVKTVFLRHARGDAYFTVQLRAELVEAGLKFVSKANLADAILEIQGDSVGRAFSGQIKFTDRNGRAIWSHHVLRPAGSNVMAYRTLSQALRVARGRES